MGLGCGRFAGIWIVFGGVLLLWTMISGEFESSGSTTLGAISLVLFGILVFVFFRNREKKKQAEAARLAAEERVKWEASGGESYSDYDQVEDFEEENFQEKMQDLKSRHPEMFDDETGMPL